MTAAIFRFLAWCNLAGGALLVLNALSGGTVLLPKVPIIEAIIWLLISAASWTGPMAVAQVLEDLEAIRIAVSRPQTRGHALVTR